MRWRTVGRVAVAALVGFLVRAAVPALGIARATGEIYAHRDAPSPPQLSGPAWPWPIALRPVLIAAFAVTVSLIIQLLFRRRQGGIDATAHRS
jgi:hypothetical protein